MKLCSHVVKSDCGLAPNPFYGYCTAAVCTPNHMNAKLSPGDWIIGHSPKSDGNRLIYAMRISEVLHMDAYFRDRRFREKKPKPNGTPKEQCGDNFYYRKDGQWYRLPSRFHNNCESFNKDLGRGLKGRAVFVAEYFYYFGSERVAIEERFNWVIQDRQGVHYTRDDRADEFVTWLEDKYKYIREQPGRPMDLADHSRETDLMYTEWRAKCPQQTDKKNIFESMPK